MEVDDNGEPPSSEITAGAAPAPNKKILVLETSVKTIDLEKLQPEDRKKYYDDLAEKNKDTPLEVFISMYGLLEDEIKMNEIKSGSMSTVPELMLRQAITQSYFLYYVKQGIKPYNSFKMLIEPPPSTELILEPIIEELIVKQDILRAPTFARGGGGDDANNARITGGKKIPPAINKAAVAQGGIKIRFEHRVQCRMPSGKPYTTTPGEEVTIIALIMRPICTSLGLRERQSLESVMLSGAYDLSSLASDCGKYFEHPDDSIPDSLNKNSSKHSGTLKNWILKEYGTARSETEMEKVKLSGIPYYIPKKSIVVSTNDLRGGSVLSDILGYIKWFQNYYLGDVANIGVIDRMSYAISVAQSAPAVPPMPPNKKRAKGGRGREKQSIIESAVVKSPMNNLIDFFSQEVVAVGGVFSGEKMKPIVTAPIPEILQRKQIMDVIAKISAITLSNISLGNPIAMIDDLRRIGAYRIYLSALTLGPDSKATKLGLQQLQLDYTMKNTQMKNAMVLKDESSKAAAYLRIINKNFGELRGKKVLHDLRNLSIKKSGDVLSALSKRESEIIVREYTNRINFEKSSIENKCPHVISLVRFRSATNIQQMKEQYNILRKFFKKGTGELPRGLKNVVLDERYFIKCAVCGFDILCPHVNELTLINTDINSGRDSKPTAEIVRDRMQKYLDDRDTKGNHFCSICAERIEGLNYYDTNLGDFDVETYSSIKDELKSEMWKEITLIINTMHFGPSIKVSHIVSMSISGIHEYIREVENQLKLSRTNTADDIRNKKKLFIIMYSYAYLIHLIVSIGGKASGKSPGGAMSGLSIDFIDYKGKAGNVSEYIKYAIIKIAKTKSALIKSVPNITVDFIKNKIIDAYKLISTKGVEQITLTNENHYRLLLLDADPIYSYYYFASSLAAGKMMSVKDKAGNIQNIIGVTITKLDTIPSLYSKTKMTHLDKGRNKNLGGVRGALSRIPQIKYLSAASKKDLHNAFTDNFIASYESFFEYVNLFRNSGSKFPHRNLIFGFQSNISTRWSPLLNSTGEIYKSDSQLMGAVGVFDHIEGGKVDSGNNVIASNTVDARMKLYIKKQTELLKQRGILQEHFRVNYLLNVVSFYSPYNPYFVQQIIPLSDIYDEKGESHKWTILVVEMQSPRTVVQGGAKKTNSTTVASNVASAATTVVEEITGDFALKELNSGKFLHYKLIDRKCEICGVMRSKVRSLSENKITAAREEKVVIGNFFKYFYNKCPIESKSGNVMHEWVSGKCSKCNLNYSTLSKMYSEEGLKYYSEYKKVFEDALLEITEGDSVSAEIVTIPDKNYSPLDKIYSAWTFNFDQVVELSSLARVNQYAVSSIGAVEGINQKDILSGKFIPPEPESTTDTRLYTICSYIRQIVIEYGQLRNFASIDKPAQSASTAIEKSGIESHVIPNLGNLLPPTPGNWQLLINYFTMKKKPREAVSFALELFVTICLDIYKGVESSLAANIAVAENALLVAGMKKAVMREAKWGDSDRGAKGDAKGEVRRDMSEGVDQKIKDLRSTFITGLLTSILKDEELKTKPGEVNWKKLRKDKSLAVEDIMEEADDPNMAEDLPTQPTEDGEKLQSEDKAFKNYFDVDVDPAESPEDFSNEMVHVDDNSASGLE